MAAVTSHGHPFIARRHSLNRDITNPLTFTLNSRDTALSVAIILCNKINLEFCAVLQIYVCGYIMLSTSQ